MKRTLIVTALATVLAFAATSWAEEAAQSGAAPQAAAPADSGQKPETAGCMPGGGCCGGCAKAAEQPATSSSDTGAAAGGGCPCAKAKQPM